MRRWHIIWDSDFNPDDFEDENGNKMNYEDAAELNLQYLEDERMNLDVTVDGEIICMASVGRWDGRKEAYRLLGHNVKNILQAFEDSVSNCFWYSDGYEIVGKESHHDGTNYYEYRILKGETHDEQVANAEKLYSKPLTKQRIGIYTKSLRPIVKEVYGWR